MSDNYDAFKAASIGNTVFAQINDPDQVRVCADGHFEIIFLLRDDLPADHHEQSRIVYIVDEKCTKAIHEKLSAIYQKRNE